MAFLLRGLGAGPVITAMLPCSQAAVGQQCIPDAAPSSGSTISKFIRPDMFKPLFSQLPASSGAFNPLVPSLSPGTAATAATATPWYLTWWGIGLIAVGGYFGYKKFIAKGA